MKPFFGEDLFLESKAAHDIYSQIKDLPIIDYHCHLDQRMIANNAPLPDIGFLWLSGDHYKWRAMRLCGVDEQYITGDANYKEKFLQYAKIMPNLAGNPLYYWTHLELKRVFEIDLPLNEKNAEVIYAKANEKLKDMTVRTLMKDFHVAYVATTDDPIDNLDSHGTFDGIQVSPTFRPDKLFAFDDAYLATLGKVTNTSICSLDNLLTAIRQRLDFFSAHGCKIADHGFAAFPTTYATQNEAENLFAKRKSLTIAEKDALSGFLLTWLAREYKNRDMLMQLHFSVTRNTNQVMFDRCGVDSGFDVIGEPQNVSNLLRFLNAVPDAERPNTVLYTLNDTNLPVIATITGAFRDVKMGAAWWFNDTVEGIRRNLQTIAEYSALGTGYGMLTDSRSFSSYVRFEFFRRILANYLGHLVDNGEYDLSSAIQTATDLSYNNIKQVLKI